MSTKKRSRPRPSSPQRQVQQPAARHEWKSNPVVVAATTAAATVALCVGVFTNWVLPTQTARLENEMLKAKEEARLLRDSVASYEVRSKNATADLASLKSKNAALTKELKAARAGALFSRGMPYPNGLEKIRVGAPIEAIYSAFPKEKIELDPEIPDMVRVNLDDSPFQYVAYFYGKNDQKKRIQNISFNIGYGSSYPESFLADRLNGALGDPIEHPEPHYYRWRRSGGVDIYMLSERSYMVMASRYAPALWPDGS